MTSMKRITISMPDELDERIYNLRQEKEYVKCSYSEIMRIMVSIGLAASKKKSV